MPRRVYRMGVGTALVAPVFLLTKELRREPDVTWPTSSLVCYSFTADGAVPRAAIYAACPAPVRIEPAGDVKRLELSGLQGAVPVGEVLEEILIPLVGLRLVVAARPVEEQVER